MIKNIQLKIVLIFFILGMFIIIGLGLFFTNLIYKDKILVKCHTDAISSVSSL